MEQFCHGTNGGWVKIMQNPLLGGDLGTCFDISMLQENGRILLYFSWRDKGNISLCTSTDGIHWDAPRTCISPRPSKEGREDDLNRPSVVRVGTIYHMWYTGQFKPGQADGTSDIFHAVSEDGVHFTRTGDAPVLSAKLPWEKQAVMCPSVIWDEENGKFFGEGPARLLRGVEETGSLRAAATAMGMAYSKAWKIINAVEKEFGVQLIDRDGARGSALTPEAKEMISRYHEMNDAARKAAEAVFRKYYGEPEKSKN